MRRQIGAWVLGDSHMIWRLPPSLRGCATRTRAGRATPQIVLLAEDMQRPP